MRVLRPAILRGWWYGACGKEPGLGVPPGARRVGSLRLPCESGDRAADPPRPGLSVGSSWPGHLLAHIPADPGRGPAGLRLFLRGHDLSQAAARAVPHGGSHPAGWRRHRELLRRLGAGGPAPLRGRRRSRLPQERRYSAARGGDGLEALSSRPPLRRLPAGRRPQRADRRW